MSHVILGGNEVEKVLDVQMTEKSNRKVTRQSVPDAARLLSTIPQLSYLTSSLLMFSNFILAHTPPTSFLLLPS